MGIRGLFFYRNLRDNQIIIDQAQETPAFAVYEGPALIFKAYMAAGLTDILEMFLIQKPFVDWMEL